MALLNEKRNRIPLVAVLPDDGDDNGIRGQMRMAADAVDGVVQVCVRSDEHTASALTIGAGTAAVTYTSIAIGDEGELVNVTHIDPGGDAPLSVVVVGFAITVNLEYATGAVVSTAREVRDAVIASTDAAALVVATDDGTGAGTAVAAVTANLSGGAGDKATVATVNTDITLTAVSSGTAGNDISITIVNGGAGSGLSVSVSGNAITVTGDTAAHDTTDIQNAINASSLASRLVVATDGDATALTGVGETFLTGGLSTALWLTLTAGA